MATQANKPVNTLARLRTALSERVVHTLELAAE